MKSKRLIFTLLSAAAFGLTSIALQAQDTTETATPDRVMDRRGRNVEKPQLSTELQAQVDAFRAARTEMLRAFRAQYSEEREAIHALMLKYRNGDLTEEEKADLLAEINEMKDAHQDEVRAIRQALRTQMRGIREQIRLERGKVTPEG